MPTIKNIYLDQNPIATVPPDAFDGLSLLVILNLDNCRLTEIPNLNYLANRLKEFHIRNNSLTFIPEDQFDNLLNLELLDLRDNFIMDFPNLLPVRDTLKYLHLDNTGISNITDTHLRQVPLLVQLTLTSNELETFPDVTWIRNLNQIHLQENPFICDTLLCWKVYIHTSVNDAEYPDCTGPTGLAGTNLLNLEENVLCEPGLHQYSVTAFNYLFL